MAPKLKTKTAADASPAPPSPRARNLCSSGRVTRSNSNNARLVSLEDTQKKSERKDKGKKAAEGEGASGTGSGPGADPKDKGKKAAEPEGGDSDIVVEHCTQCKSFLRRATEVKDGLEGSQTIDVVVEQNPEKPSISEITSQFGTPLIQLPTIWKPEMLKCRTRPHLCRGVKRPRDAPNPLPNIIFPYEYDTAFEGAVSHNSLGVMEFPMDANRINNPMANGMPIGATHFTSTVQGLAFLVAETYHRVCNVGMGLISNQSQQPIIIDPQVAFLKYSLGYCATSNRYKIVRFTHLFDEGGEATDIHVYTCGVDNNWRGLGRTPFGIADDDDEEMPPNEGISTMDGGSSSVSFFGELVLDDDIPRRRILSFDFSNEEIDMFPTPENVDGDPVLCNLRNRLSCTFFSETALRIFHARPNHTWELAIHITSLPNLGIAQSFFPIGIHETKLLIAYICWLEPGDDIPPEIPVDALNFFNHSQGLLVDTITGTVEFIDCFETFDWFSAKTIVETDEPLPY